MMQQVATSKTNIASPSAVQDKDIDNQQQGSEFAAIFKQQETQDIKSRSYQGAEKKIDNNGEGPQAKSDEKQVEDKQEFSASADKQSDKEHDCEDCKHHTQQTKKDEPAASDKAEASETSESDDLLSLLQASQAADIKHSKVAKGDKTEPVDITPIKPVAEPVVDVEQQKTAQKEQGAVHIDLSNAKLSADVKQQISELSAELKLSPEQQEKLTALVQQLSQKADSSEVSKLQKADVKLLASLMDGKNADAALTKLTSKISDKELAAMLELPEAKADKVIQQIAAALGQGQKSKADNKVDFVASLKAGLSEIKQQLQQGHEPGIDLKSLIQQAMAKSGETEVQIKPEQLTQSLHKLSQILEVASAKEQSQNQALPMTTSDRSLAVEGQVRAETVRQGSQQAMQAQLDRPVNILKPEGHQQLANKVQMMVNQKNMVAEIRLDPPDLGSMSIKINMQGEQASVSFVVQSQQAQNVLEQSAPRLREMLAERGIELGQSSVQQDNPGKQAQQEGEQLADKSKQGESDEPEQADNMHIHTRVVNGALGGIDFFA